MGFLLHSKSSIRHSGNTTTSTVQEIKQAVRNLPLSKRLKVVKWVTAFDNDEWDKEMAKDGAERRRRKDGRESWSTENFACATEAFRKCGTLMEPHERDRYDGNSGLAENETQIERRCRR